MRFRTRALETFWILSGDAFLPTHGCNSHSRLSILKISLVRHDTRRVRLTTNITRYLAPTSSRGFGGTHAHRLFDSGMPGRRTISLAWTPSPGTALYAVITMTLIERLQSIQCNLNRVSIEMAGRLSKRICFAGPKGGGLLNSN